jgi:hypothetical protein
MPVNILHKHKDSVENKQKFGKNKLLFDILVCQSSTFEHMNSTSDLTVITKSLWQVESGLAKRKILTNFRNFDKKI